MDQRKTWQNEPEIGYVQLSQEQTGKRGYVGVAQNEGRSSARKDLSFY